MAYNIGSQVAIKTRTPSWVMGREFEERTHVGIVVTSPHWLGKDYVSVRTDNPAYPVSHIHLSRIVGHEASLVQNNLRLFKVTSKSKGKSYEVTVRDGRAQCDCIGFQFHRYCRHSTSVKKLLGI